MNNTALDFQMWEDELTSADLDLCVHVQPTVGCTDCCPCAVCRNRRAS